MSTFAVGGTDEIHIFEGFTNVLTIHTGMVIDIALISDSILASGEEESTIKIWNFKTGECIKELKEHKKDIYSLHFKPPYTLLSGSLDKTLKIWNIIDWSSKTIEFKKEVREICEIETIYILDQNDTIFIVNLDTLETIELIHFDQNVYSIVKVPGTKNNRYLVGGNYNIFICEGSKIIETFGNFDDYVIRMCFFPSGDMVSISYDQQIIIWDLEINTKMYFDS